MNGLIIRLLDLPNEILLIILKKLGNINVLYSFIDIGVERLELLAQDKIFTNTINLTSTDSGHICSVNNSILDRFCIDILPQIQCSIRYLIVEATAMERLALTDDYPNLTKLKIFQFNKVVVSLYFTDKSNFGRIVKQQITDLILMTSGKHDILTMKDYTRNVCARIIDFCENLKYLNIDQSSLEGYHFVSFCGLPSTIFSSLTLTKLSIRVYHFEDCLCLLDGRLKHLTNLTVNISYFEYVPSVVSNSNNLPNLKCFSLICMWIFNGYDAQIVPLLRRMCNLEELTLNLEIHDRATFVDGTHLHNEILIHMPRLQTFTFHIITNIMSQNLVRLLNDDIHRTFINTGHEQVGCIVNYFDDRFPRCICHIFSLPFPFDRLDMISNQFPSMIFNNVTMLMVLDCTPFEHEFFVRIARSFPLLNYLRILNNKSNAHQSDLDNNQSHLIVEYPHLTILEIRMSHICYIEQFLHESKTRLPRLMRLIMNYNELQTVTENFTRDATRLNCVKVKWLIMREMTVYPKELYDYFPSLYF